MRAENQDLKDEIARLKGHPPRPKFKSKPSGMEKARSRSKRAKAGKERRGSVKEKLAVTSEAKLKVEAPPASRFKGYEDVFVQDLQIRVAVVRYRRERWETKDGERIIAPLPQGILRGLVHKLQPRSKTDCRAVDLKRSLIWWLYADLKAYQREPDPKRARALRARFDRIFTRPTGYPMLDRLLRRLYHQKSSLLRVLERPEIPLHTNGSESDIRALVTKRKISGGTVSEAGKIARDTMLGLMKTCAKLGVSYYRFLGDRFHVPGVQPVPSLAGLIAQAAG